MPSKESVRKIKQYQKQIKLLEDATDCLETWADILGYSSVMDMLFNLSNSVKVLISQETKQSRHIYAKNIIKYVYTYAVNSKTILINSDDRILKRLTHDLLAGLYSRFINTPNNNK